ncbi:hypothetical protein PVK06_016642 [Gossypium arboreum]|uniref:DUF7745 domain-containing protein n=1 Tax=Gossypium arboreum TaxID=29729 RepID=A0ABR0Q0H7_GOSAR|nr:hypothetical protein PVK06_016642 [Gossypium arboreum]
MLHLAFGPMPGPIPFRRSSLRVSCGNMSLHKFKDYFMDKMNIDVRVANATVYAMEVLPPKGQPLPYGYVSLLKATVRFWDPTYRCFMFNEVDIVSTIKKHSTILHYDFRDPLRIYWKRNVDFRGSLTNLMGLLVDTMKARLKDKNGHRISGSDIRDAIGKANSERHLSLFAFSIYELIVFPKALGYVSVELANFSFQIEKKGEPCSSSLN